MDTLDVVEAIRFDPARPTSKVLLDLPAVRVILFCLESGQEVPAHASKSEVVFYTVQGSGVASVGEEQAPLRPGAIVRCPPDVNHGLKGQGDGLVVLAAIAPRPW